MKRALRFVLPERWQPSSEPQYVALDDLQSTLRPLSRGDVASEALSTLTSSMFFRMSRPLGKVLNGIYKLRHVILVVILVLVGESVFHHVLNQVVRPEAPLDPPFATSCREPPSTINRQNATLLMLARNKEISGAVTTIRSVENRFNRFYHYPIVFLNDEPWSKDFKDALLKEVSGEAIFEQIPKADWSIPSYVDAEQVSQALVRQEHSGILYGGREGYHHMCRYNSGLFFDHPALQKYKWYWRIEPNVEYTCTITYDPFEEMVKAKKRYGYTIALWELGRTCPSLFRHIADWKRKHNIQSSNLWNSFVEASYIPWPFRLLLSYVPHHDSDGSKWNLCHYWSNFEIADMDLFRSEQYRDLFSTLDHTGGFYFERWGDAPIHSLAVAMLLNPKEVHQFQDIGYIHDHFQTCPINAQGKQMPESALLNQSGHWDAEDINGIGCRCKCSEDKTVVARTCNDKLRRSIDP